MLRLLGPLRTWILARAAGLRFPWLAALTAALFLLDLLVPDALPFVDEMVLGLLALLLASWRDHRLPRKPPP